MKERLFRRDLDVCWFSEEPQLDFVKEAIRRRLKLKSIEPEYDGRWRPNGQLRKRARELIKSLRSKYIEDLKGLFLDVYKLKWPNSKKFEKSAEELQGKEDVVDWLLP